MEVRFGIGVGWGGFQWGWLWVGGFSLVGWEGWSWFFDGVNDFFVVVVLGWGDWGDWSACLEIGFGGLAFSACFYGLYRNRLHPSRNSRDNVTSTSPAVLLPPFPDGTPPEPEVLPLLR